MFENTKQKLINNSILINEALTDCFKDNVIANKTLTEAQKYGVLSGGKRIRAFLIMEIARIFNGDIDSAIRYACAIEMMHASSLIHDDLPCMDNDDFRRGLPSTHKVYGEAIALLAGDALILKAVDVLNNSKNSVKAIQILLNGSGERGMLSGQAIDMESTDKNLTFDELVDLHRYKTGKLISASARLGCLACNICESDPRFSAIINYAENLGLAFQILDDILDYKEGKAEQHSFLAYMPLAKAQDYANRLTECAINSIRPYDSGSLQELAEYLTTREY